MNTASPILIQSTREMTFSLFDEANKNREKKQNVCVLLYSRICVFDHFSWFKSDISKFLGEKTPVELLRL